MSVARRRSVFFSFFFLGGGREGTGRGILNAQCKREGCPTTHNVKLILSLVIFDVLLQLFKARSECRPIIRCRCHPDLNIARDGCRRDHRSAGVPLLDSVVWFLSLACPPEARPGRMVEDPLTSQSPRESFGPSSTLTSTPDSRSQMKILCAALCPAPAMTYSLSTLKPIACQGVRFTWSWKR